MELLRAALDGHGDGAAGGDAVIRRIVAGQHLELAECVLRRHDRHLAAGTAVICLAAVDDPDVVRLVEPLKLMAVVGVHRERILHVRQVAADAQAQCRQADTLRPLVGSSVICCSLISVLTTFESLCTASASAATVMVSVSAPMVSLMSTRKVRKCRQPRPSARSFKALGRDLQVVVGGVQTGDVIQSGSVADGGFRSHRWLDR
jgi:hypothetical protein